MRASPSVQAITQAIRCNHTARDQTSDAINAIIFNQKQSEAGDSEAITEANKQSEAIRGNQRQSSEAIRGNQRPGEAIRGNQMQPSEAIRGNQSQAKAIRSNQRQSESR